MTRQTTGLSRHKRVSRISFGTKVLESLLARLKGLTMKMTRAGKKSNERQMLSYLSDHQLKDIGLVRDQLVNESNRAIFDPTTGRYFEIGFRQGGLGSPDRPGIFWIPKD